MTDTRTAILQKNFQSICQTGFQATRTDKVIVDLGITKGAFYHYFPDKLSLGYAIVDEIILPMYVNAWVEAKNNGKHSVDVMIDCIQHIKSCSNNENIGLGCPLNNLIQEMSTIDQDFRIRLARVVELQLNSIIEIIVNGIQRNEIKSEVIPENLAHFILAGIEGSYTIGKSKNSLKAFQSSMDTLVYFLNSIKI